MLIIRECGSTLLVGLMGIVQMLIPKSKEWKRCRVACGLKKKERKQGRR